MNTRGLSGRRIFAPVMAVLLILTVVIAFMAWQRPVSRDFHLPIDRTTLPVRSIDLNRAPESELMLLPGIGPRLAERIVQDREINGAFGSPEELQRVSGIGPRTVERVTPLAVVSAGAVEACATGAPTAGAKR